MKHIIAALLFFLHTSLHAGFDIIILDSDISPSNTILKNVSRKLARKHRSRNLLKGEARDYYLERYFYDYVQGRDIMDRDLFYKSLMTHPFSKLKAKYKWLKRSQYKEFIKSVPSLHK